MASAQIFLFENDISLLEYYGKYLKANGFDEILALSDTKSIIETVARAYKKPSIIISDYYIDPSPPSRYLPEMRRRGINIPIIIVSGGIAYDDLNSLALNCNLAGFFSKGGAEPRTTIGKISQHCIDLVPDAIDAYRLYQTNLVVKTWISSFKPLERQILFRLLCLEEVKRIAAEESIGSSTVYDLRKTLGEFLGPKIDPETWSALAKMLPDDLIL